MNGSAVEYFHERRPLYSFAVGFVMTPIMQKMHRHPWSRTRRVVVVSADAGPTKPNSEILSEAPGLNPLGQVDSESSGRDAIACGG
jgi:hypothetical protein